MLAISSIKVNIQTRNAFGLNWRFPQGTLDALASPLFSCQSNQISRVIVPHNALRHNCLNLQRSGQLRSRQTA